MKILNWEKPVIFSDADKLLIQKAQAGQLNARVKIYLVQTGDFYQKYDQQTGEKIEKEKHVFLEPDKKQRKNWGDLRSALIRGTKTGDIVSYRLMKTGELSVVWFTGYKAKQSKPIEKRSAIQPTPRSTIPAEEHEKDVRRKKPMFLSIRRKRSFVPHDSAVEKFVWEYERRKDHEYLHSEQARVERSKAWRTVDDPEYCTNWVLKFKTRAHIYSSGTCFGRSSEEVLASNRKNRENAL